MLDDAELDEALAYVARNRIRGTVTSALVVGTALKRGVEVTVTDRRAARLTVGQHSFTFANGATSLNSPLAKRVARQKEVTSRLLLDRGVKAPENAYFSARDVRRAWAWAKPVRPVVVKPHGASQGRRVHVNITNRREFARAFADVAEHFSGVLVETFQPGTEHRALVVDGHVVAATRRVPANVVGDGSSTVAQLVQQKNQERKERRDRIHSRLTLDDSALAELKRQGLSAGSVPSADRHVFLRSISNIHAGGDAIDATDELAPDEVRFVERAATAIPGLRLAGFDVLLPRRPSDTSPAILEINPAPMLSMHHFPWEGKPRDAAGALLDAAFSSASSYADNL